MKKIPKKLGLHNPSTILALVIVATVSLSLFLFGSPIESQAQESPDMGMWYQDTVDVLSQFSSSTETTSTTTHNSYNFASDFVSTDGNVTTEFGCDLDQDNNPVSFFDHFDDGSLTSGCTDNFNFNVGTFQENNSRLVMDSDQGEVTGNFLSHNANFQKTFEDGDGDFTFDIQFRPDTPQPGPNFTSYGIFLSDRGSNLPNLSIQTGLTPSGDTFVVAGRNKRPGRVFRSVRTDFSQSSGLVFRIQFNDSTNEITPMWSADNGQTFNTWKNPDNTDLTVPLFDTDSRASSRIFAFENIGDAKDPVVIVPGILGSRLVLESDPQEEVWPNTLDLFRLPFDTFLNELRLNSNGNEVSSKGMEANLIIDKEEILLIFEEVFYGNLVNSLEDEDFDVFSTPYDWRLDLRDTKSTLANKIQKARDASPTNKVDIIAHSMGGLLTKEYLLSQSDLSFIDQVIFAGVPNLGAPKDFKLHAFGDAMNIEWMLFGLDPQRTQIIAENMPATYQLLPSRKYLNKFFRDNYVSDWRDKNAPESFLSFQETKSFLKEDVWNRNDSMIDDADDYHQDIDNKTIPVDNFFNIVGCNIESTVGAIDVNTEDDFDLRGVDGDGTVPRISADSFPTANTFFVKDIRHMGLVRESNSVDFIRSILEGNVDTSIPGISSDASQCLSTQEIVKFSIHSPAELHIFDSQGRHLGPTENGAVEFEISDSDYEFAEDNKFAWVPAGDNYRVEIRAEGKGSFRLNVNSLKGTEVQSAATFVDVPLQTTSTKAEIRNVTSTKSALNLELDNEGDGTVDEVVQPTSVVSGNQARDFAPPEISLSSIPDQIILNDTHTFNFSATDDNSGVGSIKATLNSDPITSGDPVTLSEAGKHTLRIKAVDKAGNPRVREVSFRVVYDFSGLLPPLHRENIQLEDDQSVPVKFQLRDINQEIIKTASASLFFAPVTNGEVGEFQPAESVGQENQSNLFTFSADNGEGKGEKEIEGEDDEERENDEESNDKNDNEDGEDGDGDGEDGEGQELYIFNWSLKSLDSGDYRLRIDLDDTISKFKNVTIKGEDEGDDEGEDESEKGRSNSPLFSSLLGWFGNLFK